MNSLIRMMATAVLGASVAAWGTGAAEHDAAGAIQPDTATAIFAGGCFWCVEEAFDQVDGVIATRSGYTGGHVRNPTYSQVSSGGTGHTEAVEVIYDPSKVSYERLLRTFWRNIDPLDAAGQFCDRGEQYRSAIFPLTPEQQRLAEASKQQVATRLGRPVATTIAPARPFYAAEEYHQDYYRKNPLRYKIYKWNCGRAQRLERIWGSAPEAAYAQPLADTPPGKS
jgi:peptide-methionine (S)-S-oxide reductase